MGTQQNGTETNKTERKTTISLTADEAVGLIMEWAKGWTLPKWMERMIEDIQDMYDSVDNQPTEDEKIDFISTFAHGIPDGEHVKDVILRFLKNYRGEGNE